MRLWRPVVGCSVHGKAPEGFRPKEASIFPGRLDESNASGVLLPKLKDLLPIVLMQKLHIRLWKSTTDTTFVKDIVLTKQG